MRSLAVLLIAFMCEMTAASAAHRVPRLLTRAQAERLAIAAIKASAPRLVRMPSFQVEAPQPIDDDRYIQYEAMANPGNQYPAYAHTFVVIDRRTAEVWNAYGDCALLTSPEIRRLQYKFRRELGLSSARPARIERRPSYCD